MKITKKQPLRPRGRSEEKRQSTKNAIRDAYINGPQKEVQIIPAKRDTKFDCMTTIALEMQKPYFLKKCILFL